MKKYPIENLSNVCPYCKKEGTFEYDHDSWKLDGDFLNIPAICSNCGKKSIEVYHIQFEQTEGME